MPATSSFRRYTFVFCRVRGNGKVTVFIPLNSGGMWGFQGCSYVHLIHIAAS
jgi:hypothetical protein